jgi:phage terminase large subunit-like protein
LVDLGSRESAATAGQLARLGGRGFGKTRTGAEWIRHQVNDHKRRRVALVAPAAADVREVMVEGESGILAISPEWERPRYERTIKTPAGLPQWRNSDNLQRGGLIRPHRMAKRLTRRGILVAGKDRNGHGYVLADRSGRYPPTEWARVAISLYGSHAADRIVAERNNGGDMVEATIRMVNPNVPVTTVWASRGKIVRAEPAQGMARLALA